MTPPDRAAPIASLKCTVRYPAGGAPVVEIPSAGPAARRTSPLAIGAGALLLLAACILVPGVVPLVAGLAVAALLWAGALAGVLTFTAATRGRRPRLVTPRAEPAFAPA